MATRNLNLAISNQIEVIVTPVFLPQQSMPDKNLYIWAYNVIINNNSAMPVKLISRYWKIIDANGGIQEVYGPGVIGEQPVISPKEYFQYVSGTHLNTPSGMMLGRYEMLDLNDNNNFEIEIPAFSLDSPFGKVQPS
jgi:ApaG protein